MNKYIWISIKMLFVSVAFLIFFSCGNNSKLLYDEDIDKVIKLAKEMNKPFCVILINDESSPITYSYLDKLENGKIKRRNRVIFNIVDSSLPENKWYSQWLGINNDVITCVFSPSGILMSIVTGASSYSFDCINRTLDNDLYCREFGYNPLLSIVETNDKIDFLNLVLECHINIRENKDIDTKINRSLNIGQYPYNLYLKLLNSQIHGNHDDAKYLAEQLFTFDNSHYLVLYSDIYDKARYIINPNFDPKNEPLLTINKKHFFFDNSVLNQSNLFEMILSNSGESDLIIKDVDVGCSCIRMIDNNIPYIIKPKDSITICLEFIPDKAGELNREIFIVSNAINRLETVKVKANVE